MSEAISKDRKQEVTLEAIRQWFEEHAFSGISLETLDQVLVVKLPEGQQGRLLADEALRKEVVAQAKALGFSRAAVELIPDVKSRFHNPA